MKSKILLWTFMAFVPGAAFAQIDDMYFMPKKEEPKKKSTVVVTYEEPAAAEEAYYATGTLRDVDEYNRRGGSYAGAPDTLQAEEAEEETDEYRYSKRILRFCTPTIGVAVSSPLYWDLCYGPNSIYWDVYDDGLYAYAFPSSWNSLYWGYSWGWPYYSWGWPYYHWGWGRSWYAGWWYDPWYYRPHPHHHWGGAGHGIAAGRPLNRPSVRYREQSTLARGNARRGSSSYYTTRRSPRSEGSSAYRHSATPSYRNSSSRPSTSRSSRSNSSTTRQSSPSYRSSTPSSRGNSSYTPSRSSGSSFRQSFSSPSRSGGGFSPSRGGGGGARGGRR